MTRSVFRCTTLLLATLAFAACGDDETGPEEDHTPHSAALFINGVDVTDGVILPAGETVRAEVRFLDEDGEVITGIEDHFAGLTFTPSSLATVTRVVGDNFQHDVTAQADAGTGSVVVGYGHDEAADELEFPAINVTIVATGGAR